MVRNGAHTGGADYMQAYRAKRAKLLLEKISLGKEDAERRKFNAIQARLAEIEKVMDAI